jgi:hypothetical protein
MILLKIVVLSLKELLHILKILMGIMLTMTLKILNSKKH